MEVFLYQLYALLKADHYNVALLSGKVSKLLYMGKLAIYQSCSVGMPESWGSIEILFLSLAGSVGCFVGFVCSSF